MGRVMQQTLPGARTRDERIEGREEHRQSKGYVWLSDMFYLGMYYLDMLKQDLLLTPFMLELSEAQPLSYDVTIQKNQSEADESLQQLTNKIIQQRERDREIKTERERKRDREIERETQTERQRERQTERQRDRERQRETE